MNTYPTPSLFEISDAARVSCWLDLAGVDEDWDAFRAAYHAACVVFMATLENDGRNWPTLPEEDDSVAFDEAPLFLGLHLVPESDSVSSLFDEPEWYPTDSEEDDPSSPMFDEPDWNGLRAASAFWDAV